jgi:hypothetical protein
MMNFLKSSLKNQLGLLVLLVSLGLFWFAMQMAGESVPDTVYSQQKQVEVLKLAVASIVKPGDSVFLSSEDANLKQELEKDGVNIYSFSPKNNVEFEVKLLSWLDQYCQPGQISGEAKNYFVWTDDTAGTVQALGNSVRGLNFFSSFEAVIPYHVIQSMVIDKIILLQPRTSLIQRYCELKALTTERPVMVIINVSEFPPLLGSFRSGQIVWLASNETRVMKRTDYEVKNLPSQLFTWSTNFAEQWSFTNQETDAYLAAIREIKTDDGLFLVDKNTPLGDVPSMFFKICRPAQIATDSFHQLCLKSTGSN